MIFSILLPILFIVQGIAPSHQSSPSDAKIRKREVNTAEKVPDFRSKTMDVSMEKKLGHTPLGAAANRHRRDEKSDIDDAEVHSAVAAVRAEEAKENALKSLADEEKLQKEISGSPKSLSSSSSKSENVGESSSKSKVISTEEEEEEDEDNDEDGPDEDGDDDNDDDAAEETIIDDGVAITEPHPTHTNNKNITTLEDEIKRQHEMSNPNKYLSSASSKNEKVGEISSKSKDGKVISIEENEEEDSEGDEDDDEVDEGDDDDDLSEETIIDDGVTQIKTTITEPHSSHTKNTTTATNPQNNESGVCKGLLDLKTMTDDFRQSLKTLLDREERVIQRLEQFEQTSRKQRTVEPSKACVYIEENVGDIRKISKSEKSVKSTNSNMDTNSNRVASSNSEVDSRVHVYTPEGVMPEPHHRRMQKTIEEEPSSYYYQSQSQNQNMNNEQQRQYYHTNANSAQSLSSLSGKSVREARKSKTNKSKSIEDSPGDDIDMSNIHWLKSESDENNANGGAPKYETVIKKIQDNGKDILIIPISSKFHSARDVARTLFDTMTNRHRQFMGRLARDKTNRRKLRLRVHRI